MPRRLPLLAACLLQACAQQAPKPPALAFEPLLRIEDSQGARAQLASSQPAPSQLAAGRPATTPAAAGPAGPVRLVPQTTMELVRIGPNEYRLQPKPVRDMLRPQIADAGPAAPGARPVLQIVNGNGSKGMADRVRRLLALRGLGDARLANKRGQGQARTVIEYLPDGAAQALAVQAALPGRALLAPRRSLPDGYAVRLVLGADLPRTYGQSAQAVQSVPSAAYTQAVPSVPSVVRNTASNGELRAAP